jgi:hypothetical protein
MIRFGIVIFHLLGILLVNVFFGGDVSVNIEASGQIDAGKEMMVQVTINKGDLNGFSRFQMELPAGITATNMSSANADFSFKDQKVRLIWLRLPPEGTLSFSFNIHCDERLKGIFDLNGKFSFIDNNERKTIDILPKSVTINPSTTIDPNLIVDIREFGRMNASKGPATGTVVCIRQKPIWSASNKNYIVTLLVNKESLKKFAKIEETVPSGFTAMSLDSKDGIFTFKDNKAKFLWMNLPVDPYFTISYKLIPAQGTTNPEILGTFSYILDDKTQTIMIIERDVDLANVNPEIVKNLIQSLPAVASNQIVNSSTQVAKPFDVAQNTKKQVELTKKQITKANPESTIAAVPKLTKLNTTSSSASDLLEPQSGIYYRVQLAAGHKQLNSKRYFKRYKLENKVLKEQHQGWIKYSVGSFNVYKDARDYRVHIWNTTSIDDAFVAAYNEGKRITVQEALMVANQKWYQ